MAFTFPISFSTSGACHQSGWNLSWEVGWPQAWESGDWVFLIIDAEPGSQCRMFTGMISPITASIAPRQGGLEMAGLRSRKSRCLAHASQ